MTALEKLKETVEMETSRKRKTGFKSSLSGERKWNTAASKRKWSVKQVLLALPESFKFVVNEKQVLVAKSNDLSWCKLKEVLEYNMRDAL